MCPVLLNRKGFYQDSSEQAQNGTKTRGENAAGKFLMATVDDQPIYSRDEKSTRTAFEAPHKCHLSACTK